MTTCDDCKGKKASHINGTCTARIAGIACGARTLSYDFKLCDDCSTKLQQCARCLRSLTRSSSTSTKSSAMFATATDADSGKSFTLKVGYELHVELPEDTFSGAQWAVKKVDPGISALNETFTHDVNQAQYGSRKFIFSVLSGAAGKTSKVELHEVTRKYHGVYWFGGQVIANPKTWSCSIVVA